MKRSGVLPILPEHEITALSGKMRQHQNRSGSRKRGDSMSVKIKASYTNDMELREILKRLHPVGSIKMQPAKGRFKRAYIELENMGLCADMVNERAEKDRK
jgi:hypothetical protein|nr:MAG TPA: hypothetical protein [Caudoviricetes sp.]